MYVKVRSMSGGKEESLTVSKLTKVEELRVMVEDKFGVPSARQRLFFQGKQLEDGYPLYEYNLNINDVIQLMERQVLAETPVTTSASKKNTQKSSSNKGVDDESVNETEYYKVGDLIDACHEGSWWEAKIVKITKTTEKSKCTDKDELSDMFVYHVEFERYHYELPSKVRLHQLRPRAHQKLKLSQLKVGDKVLVNYNIDEPLERGYWYHAKVESTAEGQTLIASIYSGEEWLSGCIIQFISEILAIPQHVKLQDRKQPKPINRVSAASCNSCLDNVRRKCKECGCNNCGGKQDPDKQIMCDECDHAYHIFCLSPPLEKIPDAEEWFCPNCKNDETEIVRAGEKLKESKRKSKMTCKNTTSTRDWGKGFACVGRTKQCTIVPSDHYGPIPGVEVGTSWMYRIQASEAGVHRPPVSGIHGRGDDGAYSIVLSGGYEDDEDNGDTFTYTGAGGRDLSGNKRTAEQSCDQKLTSTNRALASNCNCKLSENGGDAGSKWQEGKPLRVIRSYKGRKHSTYAPEEGIRYDGIYKVCKYWKQTGKSGFAVWRYLMRRDDPIPAPWTKEGKKRIQQLGLVMLHPIDKPQEEPDKDDSTKQGVKRRKSSANDKNSSDETPAKKSRASVSISYEVDPLVKKAILDDNINEKLWSGCLEAASNGYQSFISSVETEFCCICCQELLLNPVTTPCSHNACLDCIERSFKAEVYACPACRHDLGEKFKMKVNEKLSTALKKVFPGYRGTAPL